MRGVLLIMALGIFLLSNAVDGKKKTKYKWPKQMDAMRLAKQVQMQQFAMEEISRSNGMSGIKHMRQRGEGTRPYHGTSHSDDYTMAATHDHADFRHTCGMGEVVVVLNGVEFKTRHNDYLFVRIADKGAAFDDTVELDFPDVPKSVLAKVKVSDQIEEMRNYFDAFMTQHDHYYDYKPYFKAHLCYMQGTWTISDLDTLQEAFESERHYYAADSWADMFQKQRYESYSGTKENLENFAFMPTTLWNVEDDGELEFGQWNYKILCHRLDDDLPLNRLRGVDDLKTRMSLQMTYEEALLKRNARFQVNPHDSDLWIDGASKGGLLDKLMSQIPGPDGYGANLVDDAFNNVIKPFDALPDSNEVLDVSHFHRWFQNKETGAMGSKVRHRGMFDENMWVAMTTQENVLPSRLTSCTDGNCQSWEQRWVYAIPMEIIYTTPLNTWNPYGITYHKDDPNVIFNGPQGDGTRNGSDDPDFAYNGINHAKFYKTPFEFFDDPGEFDIDPADTPSAFTNVLDASGTVRKVRASGFRTFLPTIQGIGRMRQRYPIHPIHGEGSPVWKELAALRDVVHRLETCLYGTCAEFGTQPLQLTLGASNPDHGNHYHTMTISQPKLAVLIDGGTVSVITQQTNGHTHTLIIRRSEVNGEFQYRYETCNGETTCADGHPNLLIID